MATDLTIAIKIAGKLESSFNSSINQAQSGLSKLGTLGRIGATGIKAAGIAVTAASAAIGAVATGSVNTGREFESAMSSAAATAGATDEEFQMMRDAALEQGRVTSKTAAESANALEYMALAGWDATTSVKALPSVLKLSEATGLDLARTSDLVTDSMAATGVGVDGLSSYLDICTRAQNKSNQTAEQLMEAYIGVGGTMKNLNVPVQDSATALGVLANRGIKGSEAGTAMNAIMVNLTSGAGEAGEMMSSLGISAFDSNGKFIGLQATLQKVNDATKGMSDEQRNATLAAIGGKHHIDALNDLMSGLNTTNEQGISEWQALSGELNNANGALEQMASTKLDNLNGDLDIFKSSLQDVGIAIYDGMQAPMREAVQFGTQELLKLSDAMRNGGFEGLVAEVGTVLGDVVTKAAQYTPQVVQMATQLINSFLTGIQANAPTIAKGAADTVIAFCQGIGQTLPTLVSTAAELIAYFLQALAQQAPQLMSGASEFVGKLVDGIIQYLPMITTSAVQIIIALVVGLAQAAPQIIEAIPEIVSALVDGLAAVDWGEAGKQILEGIKNALNAAGGVLSDAFNTLFPSDNSAATKAGESAGAANAAGTAQGISKSVGVIAIAAIPVIAIIKKLCSLGSLASGLSPLGEALGGLGTKIGGTSAPMSSAAKSALAFGGALMMAAASMWIMVQASIQLAAAGPDAMAMMAGMVISIGALMAVAGAVGPQLQGSAAGLLAFGGAVLMAAGGMALMAFACTQMAAAGPLAVVSLGIMVGGMIALMAVAGAMGPALTAGAAGLIAFGAAVLLASVGCLIMVQAAIQLSAAGPGAGIAMALMAAGLIAFGAIAGALAPLLLAGAAAIAALGAAFLVVSAAALLGGVALNVVVAALPQVIALGTSGAAALAVLGAGMIVFGASAAVMGVSLGLAAIGVAAFGVAAGIAAIATAALALALAGVALATATIASDSASAAASLQSMVSAVSIVQSGLSALQSACTAAGQWLAGLFTGSADFTAGANAMAMAMTTAATAISAGGMMIQASMMMIQASSAATVATVTAGAMQMAVAVMSAGASAVGSARSTAAGIQGAFASVNLYSAGVNMMAGLVSGINSMSGAVMAAASSIASAAAATVNSALKVHSPSKLMIQTGQFTGQGLAIGLRNSADLVRQAAQMSLATPVISSTAATRSVEAPTFTNSRTGVISDTVRGFSGTDNGNNNKKDSSSPTFVFSPTYRFESGTPEKKDIVDANKMSQDEFAKMMKEFIRSNGRVSLA